MLLRKIEFFWTSGRLFQASEANEFFFQDCNFGLGS